MAILPTHLQRSVRGASHLPEPKDGVPLAMHTARSRIPKAHALLPEPGNLVYTKPPSQTARGVASAFGGANLRHIFPVEESANGLSFY
jgi:hypothetical protein